MLPESLIKPDITDMKNSLEVSNMLDADSLISLSMGIRINIMPKADEEDSNQANKLLELFNSEGQNPQRHVSPLSIHPWRILQLAKKILSKNKKVEYTEV